MERQSLLESTETLIKLCFTYNKSGNLSNPIYGYVIPTVALALLVLNSLAITVFMTTNRKSPTNILLTALALSDSLGVLVISPTFILVYGFENNFKVMNSQ
ncbi:sex peptide receptor-like [Mytilus californianus]|uniref:sex peptide receptor-like n=1 Tax=Mytilus californianus TaxID=6549 RepID=UPI0022476E9A|nr:sex peptide receptor-like [Mytilus californianus]